MVTWWLYLDGHTSNLFWCALVTSKWNLIVLKVIWLNTLFLWYLTLFSYRTLYYWSLLFTHLFSHFHTLILLSHLLMSCIVRQHNVRYMRRIHNCLWVDNLNFMGTYHEFYPNLSIHQQLPIISWVSYISYVMFLYHNTAIYPDFAYFHLGF